MKKRQDLVIDGALSETNPLFAITVDSFTDVHIDFSRMSYINSIGVKNWMIWIYKIPSSSQVFLHQCPFVIINQSVIVTGFLPQNAFLASFQAPYFCESCHEERYHLLRRGEDYEYSNGNDAFKIDVPEDIPCPKCSGSMTPDFVFEKTFLFLKQIKKDAI